MTKKDLTLIGAMLYACEGTKARRDLRAANRYIYSIELTNSDNRIISIFSRFLIEIIRADWKRVRGQIFSYPDLNSELLTSHWSEVSGIPRDQFQKTIVLKSKNGKFKPSPYGTFKIRYSCKSDFVKLQDIINRVWRDAGVADQADLESLYTRKGIKGSNPFLSANEL